MFNFLRRNRQPTRPVYLYVASIAAIGEGKAEWVGINQLRVDNKVCNTALYILAYDYANAKLLAEQRLDELCGQHPDLCWIQKEVCVDRVPDEFVERAYENLYL